MSEFTRREAPSRSAAKAQPHFKVMKDEVEIPPHKLPITLPGAQIPDTFPDAFRAGLILTNQH
jgi:hypothetical protein